MSKTMALVPQGEHFTLARTGLTMKEGASFEEWRRMYEALLRIEGAIQWWIGDLLNYEGGKYGSMYVEAIKTSGAAYQTLRNYKWVAKAIEMSARADNLGWKAHERIAALPENVRKETIDLAAEEKWTEREARKYVRAFNHKANKKDRPPLPEGKFDVILADPGWQYEHMISESREIENHYPTMELEEICALPVEGLAADNAMLFLWATNSHLAQALTVITDWGFEYRTNMVWAKPSIGPGYYVRSRHEFLLIARRGEPALPEPADRPNSVIEAPRGKHSEKPEVFYELLEKAYPGASKIELFARRPRDGWEGWGNEV